MSFAESLTVRILGDSSELQRELDAVLGRLDAFKSKLSSTTTAARQFANSFGQLSRASQPLQQLGNQINRISQQLQALSQRPITLNVGQAIAALQRLSQAAQQAALAVRSIPQIPPTMGPPGLIPPPFTNGHQQRQHYSTGGLVTGPAGLDRVPAQLTAGEFVVNRTAVETLGLGFLEQLNATPQRVPASSRQSMSSRTGIPSISLNREQRVVKSLSVPTASRAGNGAFGVNQRIRPVPGANTELQTSATNNHFGGITIQVSQATDAQAMLRDLELNGIGRRIRRG